MRVVWRRRNTDATKNLICIEMQAKELEMQSTVPTDSSFSGAKHFVSLVHVQLTSSPVIERRKDSTSAPPQIIWFATRVGFFLHFLPVRPAFQHICLKVLVWQKLSLQGILALGQFGRQSDQRLFPALFSESVGSFNARVTCTCKSPRLIQTDQKLRCGPISTTQMDGNPL